MRRETFGEPAEHKKRWIVDCGLWIVDWDSSPGIIDRHSSHRHYFTRFALLRQWWCDHSEKNLQSLSTLL